MSSSVEPSRIERARRQSAGAKRRLGLGAGASFLAALLLAWASHSGQAQSGPSSGTSSAGGDNEVHPASDFDFGNGSLAPPGNTAPSTGTHAS